jgi:hypothetical protein
MFLGFYCCRFSGLKISILQEEPWSFIQIYPTSLLILKVYSTFLFPHCIRGYQLDLLS